MINYAALESFRYYNEQETLLPSDVNFDHTVLGCDLYGRYRTLGVFDVIEYFKVSKQVNRCYSLNERTKP